MEEGRDPKHEKDLECPCCLGDGLVVTSVGSLWLLRVNSD